jgi:hypothetical protein
MENVGAWREGGEPGEWFGNGRFVFSIVLLLVLVLETS